MTPEEFEEIKIEKRLNWLFDMMKQNEGVEATLQFGIRIGGYEDIFEGIEVVREELIPYLLLKERFEDAAWLRTEIDEIEAYEKTLRIEYVSMYKDGGSLQVTTNQGNFCIDRRLDTKSRDKVFKGYPKDDNSNIVKDLKIIREIVSGLKIYKSIYYGPTIKSVIKSLEEGK